MAKQPETTKHAAVWSPPRFSPIYLHAGTGSGQKHSPQQWEGGTSDPTHPSGNLNSLYRMPTSGDVGHNFNF